MNLYEKIQAVSSDIKNIEKNTTVGQGKYAYKAVSDLDVITKVKQSEKKFQLLSIPFKQELVKTETIETRNADNSTSGIKYNDIIKMTTRIIDIEKPDSYIDIETFGRGLDTSDKGFGKASTYARKYALLNVYKIATGEDPDKDKSDITLIPTKDEKKTAIINYYTKHEKARDNLLSALSLVSLDDIAGDKVDKVYDNLKNHGVL